MLQTFRLRRPSAAASVAAEEADMCRQDGQKEHFPLVAALVVCVWVRATAVASATVEAATAVAAAAAAREQRNPDRRAQRRVQHDRLDRLADGGGDNGAKEMAAYQQAMCATDYLKSKVHYRPVVGIICGSGLGSIADLVGNPRMVRYDDIPGFPDCEGEIEMEVQAHPVKKVINTPSSRLSKFLFPPIPIFIGNEGKFIFGEIGGKHVVVVQRRLRTYEGHDYSVMTAPIRVIRLLGAKYLFVTTTAGGLNPRFKVGDLVMVKDHVDFSSLVGHNPLIGPHDPR
ncbi:unnamed protein product [Hydatigera taeniaeformis]|uniref:purine-nucleoside phosphorylase n=1 Tax=Hydatigena taeniaeformis TaxID=6205 RepID=A0A0R3X8I3_HYDTA|nr:unnamed protein product [Hydatigera taeniaeformis]